MNLYSLRSGSAINGRYVSPMRAPWMKTTGSPEPSVPYSRLTPLVFARSIETTPSLVLDRHVNRNLGPRRSICWAAASVSETKLSPLPRTDSVIERLFPAFKYHLLHLH